MVYFSKKGQATITLLTILSVWQVNAGASLYNCLNDAMKTVCKNELYTCYNTPECSYQLHENTKHIDLSVKSQTQDFPPLYFSNNLAIVLYGCLKKQCNLPQIDQKYLVSLPRDYCLMEVYDICGGDLQKAYQKVQSASIMQCYNKYCPNNMRVQ